MLDFAFPKESNGPLEIQEGNVYGGYGKNHIYFIISKKIYHNSSLEQSAQCIDENIDSLPENCTRKKEYILYLPFYSILKFTNHYPNENTLDADLVLYLIKMKDEEFFVRGHAKTLDDQAILDTTMLNLKVGTDSPN